MRGAVRWGLWACVGLAGCRPWTAAWFGIANEGTRAGECTDAADNDADEVYDCADDGCATAVACTAPVAPGPSGPATEGQDWRSPSVGRMVWIAVDGVPGEAPPGPDRQAPPVVLDGGYWLMEHEVTRAEWRSVMGADPSADPSCGPSCPVTDVSWSAAVDFARRLSARDGVTYRLPTEAEWEHAARAGDPPGDAPFGWSADNSGEHPHPVCGRRRDALGLCDMSGNVWEWVAPDAMGRRGFGGPVGAADPEERAPSHVYRGGSWATPSGAHGWRRRLRAAGDFHGSFLGVRLVRAEG